MTKNRKQIQIYVRNITFDAFFTLNVIRDGNMQFHRNLVAHSLKSIRIKKGEEKNIVIVLEYKIPNEEKSSKKQIYDIFNKM